jgi:hypothetical protein
MISLTIQCPISTLEAIKQMKFKKQIRETKYLLGYMWEILKPTSIRAKVLIGILSVSIALMIIAVITNNSKSDNSWERNFLFSISSSSIAAVVIEAIDQITQKAEVLLNKRRFSRLFSYNDFSNQKIAIVNSAFDLSRYRHSSGYTDTRNLKRSAFEDLSRLSTKAAVKDDVIAASRIVLAFSKVALPIPVIEWDEDIIDSQSGVINTGKTNDIKTYILIGLSNEIVNNLNVKRIRGKYFSIFRRQDDSSPDISINNIRCGYFDGRNNLVEENQWIDHSLSWDFRPNSTRNNDYDYSLFAKFFLEGKPFIICGGTTEIGTRYIGEYVEQYWSQIYTQLEREKGSELNSYDSFAVIIKIPIRPGNPLAEASIMRICIEKVR